MRRTMASPSPQLPSVARAGSSWAKGSSARVDRKLQDRILLRLDALEAAAEASDLNLPGFDFHTLRGPRPVLYAVHVNGPWCLTFEFADGDAIKVDLEQYQ